MRDSFGRLSKDAAGGTEAVSVSKDHLDSHYLLAFPIFAGTFSDAREVQIRAAYPRADVQAAPPPRDAREGEAP